MKTNWIRILIVFCVIALNVQFAEAQRNKRNKQIQNASSCDCSVEYDDVVNYLFSRNTLGLGNGYLLTLRYISLNEPEWQIDIIHFKPGRFEVYLHKYKPTNNNVSILIHLQNIQQKNCNASFNEIVKQIKVEKKSVNLTENEVLKIRTGFFEAVRKTNEFENGGLERMKSDLTSIYLDPPGYNTSYIGEGNILLSGAGNYIDGKPFENEPPFIEWMREVYRIVESKTR